MKMLKPQIIFWGAGLVSFGLVQFLNQFIVDVVYNNNLAFGIVWPEQWIIPTMLAFLLLVVWWFYKQHKISMSAAISFGLVLGGGASNLYERVVYSGQVADYWDVVGLFTFNLADVSIALGIIGLIIYFLRAKA